MYALERTKLSSQKDFDYFPIFEILISEAPNIYHCDGLPREELKIGKHPALRAYRHKPPVRMARMPSYPRSPRPVRQAIGDKHIHFAVVGRAGAYSAIFKN